MTPQVICPYLGRTNNFSCCFGNPTQALCTQHHLSLTKFDTVLSWEAGVGDTHKHWGGKEADVAEYDRVLKGKDIRGCLFRQPFTVPP